MESNPSGNPPSRLHGRARTRLVRWLLEPGVTASPRLRAALVGDVDISLPGILFSSVNFICLGGIFWWLSPTPWHAALLAANGLGAATRLASVALIATGKAEARPGLVDLYCLATICWSLLQGIMAGGAMISESPPLQILAATWIMALQGSLCTRNFSVPRFAMAILCAADLPFVAGAGLSQDHWLLVIAAATPSYLYASYAAVKRFQTLSLQAYREQFLSQEAALRDPLTGALNRRGLRQAINDGISEEMLTVFYLDLDGFKMVNDLYGHTAGDRLLRGVVKRLGPIIRDGDILGRVGGDEFIIIAPAMPPEAAEAFAARLVEEITTHLYPLGNDMTARIGVSVGYACAPEDSTSVLELTHMADVALYAVKKNGKGSWQRAATCGMG